MSKSQKYYKLPESYDALVKSVHSYITQFKVQPSKLQVTSDEDLAYMMCIACPFVIDPAVATEDELLLGNIVLEKAKLGPKEVFKLL